jgi:predicted amidohydrolase YtcJ
VKFFGSIVLSLAATAAFSQTADTVYTNGSIYTVDEAQPWVEAVAIKDGKFLKVGTNEAVRTVVGESTKVVDLQGGFAMPGIGDTHLHPALVMPKQAFCSLPGTFYEPSEADILEALDKCIENYPEDREWFVGAGFTIPSMKPETLTREFLDKIFPDKPAFIEDETGGHTAWFNTAAMEAVGLDKSYEDNADGFFSRTPDGDLAGVAYEAALNPFLEGMPPFDTEVKKIAYMKLLDQASAKGITMFGDAYVFEADLEPYEQLHKEGAIKQHAVLYLKGNLGTAELTPVSELEEWWSSHELPGVKAVKLGMGGALESISEALVDGYASGDLEPIDGPIPGDFEVEEKNANPIIAADDFAAYMAELDAAGFQVKVHAIGDGTVRATLDGYQSVIEANGNNRLRHHMDHCTLIHPDDFQRFVDLDVSCTIWPPLNAPVAYNIGNIKPVLKPEVWDRMYANRERWDAGIRLVNHTDAPAAVLWPWYGMEASATRKIPGKPDSETMGEEHALTIEELIEAFTINVAWSLHVDDIAGSIVEGKSADMIVLNHNLFEVPLADIHKTEVMETIFEGEVVYAE